MYTRIVEAQANMSKGKNDEAVQDAPRTNGEANGAATQLETAKEEELAVGKGTKTEEAE
jgi:hypothetical protein